MYCVHDHKCSKMGNIPEIEWMKPFAAHIHPAFTQHSSSVASNEYVEFTVNRKYEHI